MAFDFPASPSVDQDYVAGTVTYTYNGTGWVLKGTSTGQFVSKSGDTMTGVLDNQVAIYVTNASPFITLRKPAVANRAYIDGQSNSKSRWQLNITDGDPETGSNAGNNFSLYSFKDDGTFLLQPLTIYRIDGHVALNSVVASTSPTTGALTVAGGVGVSGNAHIAGTINVTSTIPMISLYASAGNQARIGFNEGGLARAQIITQGSTGDLTFLRYDNAGSYLDSPVTIVRSAGNVVLSGTVPSTSPTTGALTVAGGVGVAGAVNCSALNVLSTGFTAATIKGSAQGITRLEIDRFNTSSYGTVEYKQAGTTQWSIGMRSGGGTNMYWFDEVGTANRMVLTPSGQLQISTNIASSNPTTGSLVVSGGLGVGGNLYTTGFISVNLTASSSPAFTHSQGINLGLDGLISNFRNTAASIETGRSNDGNIVQFFNNSSGVCGAITMGGGGTVVAYSTSSDVRLKDDLKSFDAGSIIDSTEVYDFAWKATGTRSYGALAQDVNKIYPQAVTCDNDWWGIDYSKFVPLLLQELKSVRNRLQQLEDK